MLLSPDTYQEFMARLDYVEKLLDMGRRPFITMAAVHFGALGCDLDALVGNDGVHSVENTDFVERFTEIWKRFE